MLLEGVVVLDLSDEAGAYCTKLLALLGAEVVKVEPLEGDPTRRQGPFIDASPRPEGSVTFFYHNMGKRSITLNLATQDGKDLFLRLAKQADIIVESFAPGTLDRIGLGSAKLLEVNPRLILASITAFGQDGPYAHHKTTEAVILAMGGIMNMVGFPDDPPNCMPCNQPAMLAGMHGAIGALMALLQKEETGRGQHVDISAQLATLLGTGYISHWYEMTGEVVTRTGGKVPGGGFGGGFFGVIPGGEPSLFECKDGWVMCPPMGGERGWELVVGWMAREAAADDLTSESYRKPEVRREKTEHIFQVWRAFLKTKLKREIVEQMQRIKVPCLPVNNAQDIAEDPHLESRGFFADVEHRASGRKIKSPGSPFRLFPDACKIEGPPQLGEHNVAVYHDRLGIPLDEMSRLRELGVI